MLTSKCMVMPTITTFRDEVTILQKFLLSGFFAAFKLSTIAAMILLKISKDFEDEDNDDLTEATLSSSVESLREIQLLVVEVDFGPALFVSVSQ
uniref:Bestrophin homolog n=1 Tax=Angiostrongylus cantonensis TaxID=6313 RepID=A0A0K0DPM4_ANGCA